MNPYRPLDDRYRGFLELVSSQIASNIANAQAYEEERRRAEALAEIDRTKTAFFSNVSHEFRTPLTLMLGPLEDALSNDEGQALSESRELLTVAHRNALRLQKLVNTLLDFSRLEAGRIQASYRPTDLATLTAGLASSFRSAIEKAGLTLTVDCPPLPEPMFIDHEMWEKIVLNLLSNAFKHTFTGEIKVMLRALPGKAELTIQDTGVGIPADQLPHIFERFHRVANARSRTFEGSGIGLALVNELVKLHGGTITAESVVDQGTTFTISLPAGKAHLPADHIEAETTLASTAVGVQAFVEEVLHWLPEEPEVGYQDADSSPAIFEPGELPAVVGEAAHILLADDNADMRDYLRRLLGIRYTVEAVADGQAVLEAVQKRPPDLVLTDVMMPKLDGFGLLQVLRADPRTRTIPVLMLSARAGEEARIEGMEAGADDYVVKPFSGKELLARVAAQLEMAQIRRGATSLIEMQNRVLEMVVGGFSLSDSLEVLVRSVEQHSSDKVLGSILLLDETGKHLRHAAAPSLPAAYNAAIDGVMIGPAVGSCGTTAYTKQETIVSDIANDPLWEDYKDLALEHGLRACWSTPIFSPDHGEVLGTFAMYYRQPQQPSLEDRTLINSATRTAALAIERHRLETERQQLLARLQAASFAAQAERRKMYDLFMQAPAVIAVLRGPEHIYELANPLYMQITGERPLIGKPIREALPELEGQGFYELLDEVYHTGKPFIGDEMVVKLDRDGDGLLEEVFFNFVYQPAYNEHGDVDGILVHAVEVTEQVLARRKLEESEAQLERALRAGSVGTWNWDLRHGVIRGDERLAQMIGLDPERVARGLPASAFLDTIYMDDRAHIQQRITDSLTGGNQDEAEYRILLGDGSVRWIVARGQVTYDENGNPLASSGTLVDMTERKELERQKDELLGLASHELRTPLTTIKAYAQLLHRKSGLSSQTQRLLSQVERLESLVNELLDTSRLRQGRLELQPERMDLRELAQEVLDRFADAAERTDEHRLVLEADGPVTGNWDPARLDQVLTNLVSNALKYSPEGGEVRLTVSQQADRATVTVSDQGIGMTPEEQAKLFVPFHRSAQAREVSGGFGLGLHIASEIIKQHGGTITAESASGEGTTFTVSLPR